MGEGRREEARRELVVFFPLPPADGACETNLCSLVLRLLSVGERLGGVLDLGLLVLCDLGCLLLELDGGSAWRG